MSHIPDRWQYWGETEFPYTPYYSYVEVLAPFAEPSRNGFGAVRRGKVHGANDRHEVSRVPPLIEGVRRAGLDAFLRR